MKFVTRFVANYALLFQVVTFLQLLEQICRPKRIDRLYLEENHHHKILELLHQTWSGHVHKRQAVRVRMAYHCHQVPQTNSNNKTLGDGYGMTERTEVVLVEMPFMGRLWIIVEYCGTPDETLAAANPPDKLPLNYDQVFIRDFVPSALAFFLNGEG